MKVEQISIFLENKSGRLAEVTGVLAKAGVNIRALSLADTADFGVLRLIVNDPDRCLRLLKEHEFAAQATDVIAVEVEDRPGGLYRILEVFDREAINIEYMYAFVEKSGNNAIVVFKIDEAGRAVESLKKNGISVLPENVVRCL